MSDAKTAELLTQVLERLDRMEQRLDAIQGTTDGIAPLTAKAPVIIEAVAGTAQFAFDQAVANGIDPIQGGVSALEIATIAGQPASIALVKRLLEKQAMLEKTLDLVDALDADGTLDVLIDHGGKVAPKLAKVMQTTGFNTMMDQALGDPKVIETAGAATAALVETRQSGWKPAGLFSPLSALMDSDVAKAIGFTLAIAKRFGQKL